MIQEELEKLADDFASESDRAGTVFHIGLMRGFIAGYRKGQLNPEIIHPDWHVDTETVDDVIIGETPLTTYRIREKVNSDGVIKYSNGVLSFDTIEDAKNFCYNNFRSIVMKCIETNDNSKNH
jgi:hypothetical protein